jgi:hypothetical protein
MDINGIQIADGCSGLQFPNDTPPNSETCGLIIIVIYKTIGIDSAASFVFGITEGIP